MLNRRSWVLQEQVLSAWALVFGSQQLSWHCEKKNRTEQYPDFETGPLSLGGFGRARTMLRPSNNDQARDFRDYDSGYKLVHDYSLRALTFPNDTLPAISGLATALGRIMDTRTWGGCEELCRCFLLSLIFPRNSPQES